MDRFSWDWKHINCTSTLVANSDSQSKKCSNEIMMYLERKTYVITFKRKEHDWFKSLNSLRGGALLLSMLLDPRIFVMHIRLDCRTANFARLVLMIIL